VTLRRRQQKNLSIGIADEIQIANDLERLGGARQIRDLPADLNRLVRPTLYRLWLARL
jgi:hypothetical protein